MIPKRWLVTGGSGFIGTNLICKLLEAKAIVLNVDTKHPQVPQHLPLWNNIDIRDLSGLHRAFSEFKPDFVIHLAALADFYASDEELFEINVAGSKNVLECAFESKVSRSIFVSTQYVNGPGFPFHNNFVFHPVNSYGNSKAEMEKLLRCKKYECIDWVIVRPTNVWGPYHPRFPLELWKYVKKGIYLHPAGPPVVRSYGYVKNVCQQMLLISEAPALLVRGEVFYVSDPPVDSACVLDAFSRSFRNRGVLKVPRWILRVMAYVGDVANLFIGRAPFNSGHYRRMTTDHTSREETVWERLGYQEIPIAQGISDTIAWLKEAYPEIYA